MKGSDRDGNTSKGNAGRKGGFRSRAGSSLVTILVIALAIAILAGGAYILAGRTGFLPSVVKRTQRGGSQGLLTAVADISELETLAYVRRTVFPHDYLQPDLTMTALVRLITARGGDAESALTPTELSHFHAANLASELGLATRRDQGGYVVVTAVYRFGYEIETLMDYIETVDFEEERSRILGDLPKGSLLSVEIEDLRRDRYPYGPVPVDADGWQRLTSFVVNEGLPPERMAEMEERSKEQGAHILRRLMW